MTLKRKKIDSIVVETFIFNVNSFKTFKSRKNDFDLNKFIKNTIKFLIVDHMKIVMIYNSIEIYVIEHCIENNDVRFANYFDVFNTRYFRVNIIDFNKHVLKRWIFIRERVVDFSSFVETNFFDWLNEKQKSFDIDFTQSLFLINCDELKLYVVTIFIIMYQILRNKSRVTLNRLKFENFQYYEYTTKNWYRSFCFLRYYWKKRSRMTQKKNDKNKKQNKIAKFSIFFTKRQLNAYRRNFRAILNTKLNDETKNENLKYESNLNYDVEMQRLLIKTFYIDNFNVDELKTWMFEHSMSFATNFDMKFEKNRSNVIHDLRIFKNDRRQFFDKRFARIVKRFESRYRFIHSKFFENRTIIVSFTNELKKMIKSFMKIKNVLLMKRFVQKKQNDDKNYRIETNAKKRDRFFRM